MRSEEGLTRGLDYLKKEEEEERKTRKRKLHWNVIFTFSASHWASNGRVVAVGG